MPSRPVYFLKSRYRIAEAEKQSAFLLSQKQEASCKKQAGNQLHGGVYNMPQVEPGKERQVTAVYEVPKGETGLTLTYQPYGSDAVQFQIR